MSSLLLEDVAMIALARTCEEDFVADRSIKSN